MDKRTKDIIALSFIEGAGPNTVRKLLDFFDDTESIFHVSHRMIRQAAGRSFPGIDKISSVRESGEYRRELEYIDKEDICVLCIGGEGYPDSLLNIYDPPPVLFVRGEIKADSSKNIAVIGSRRCSLYGIQMAERLSFDLAQKGITIVSGMARGIDSAAHRGALKSTEGGTVAVMGSGFNNIYPPESEALFNDICSNGAVITEYTSEIKPLRHNFPRRNRIISALSRGVVVVEAARKSGAMITVDMALDQGKEIFAVPGRADINTSDGTNFLIKEGAKLVTCAEDIVEEFDMGILNGFNDHGNHAGNEQDNTYGGICGHIMSALEGASPVHIDDITEKTGAGRNELTEELLKLEIKGKIKALAGRKYILS